MNVQQGLIDRSKTFFDLLGGEVVVVGGWCSRGIVYIPAAVKGEVIRAAADLEIACVWEGNMADLTNTTPNSLLALFDQLPKTAVLGVFYNWADRSN